MCRIVEQRIPFTSFPSYFLLTSFLLRFFVVGVLPATGAKLRQRQLLGVGALVLRRGVIALPTIGTFEGDDDSLCGHDE
jgi:hypothetical protein